MGPGTSVAPGSTPQGTAALTPGDLRLALIDHFGARWYCDPDVYPVARADEESRAIERVPEVQRDSVVYPAILKRLGLAGTTDFTKAEKVTIYRLWKVAVSLPLDPAGTGTYRFDYTAEPPSGAAQGTRSEGTISDTGAIVVERQSPAEAPNCPICLARGTPIDTPLGEVAVDRLRLGDPVWTFDLGGRRVAGVVTAVGSSVAPIGHRVVRLELADGRAVVASPGHPLWDRRLLGTVNVGEVVDGSAVVAAVLVPYASSDTYDIATSGPTAGYYAGGIRMRSTLVPLGS